MVDADLGALHVNLAVAYYMQKKAALSRKHALMGKKLDVPQVQRLLDELDRLSKSPALHRQPGRQSQAMDRRERLVLPYFGCI